MRIYCFNNTVGLNNTAKDFSLLRIVEETDFTDEEFDRLASLNVGGEMAFDEDYTNQHHPGFTITRIR